MTMVGDSLYLENIQEYVQDEDKIVRILALFVQRENLRGLRVHR